MRLLRWLSLLVLALPVFAACGAASSGGGGSGGGGGNGGAAGSGGGAGDSGTQCGYCLNGSYTPCENGQPGTAVVCQGGCMTGVGCVDCNPGMKVCVGNEVHGCTPDGKVDTAVVETCDIANGKTCDNGSCQGACEVAAGQPSNLGCEFWAVDLDQQDFAGNDPASAPWGVVLSNAGQATANVTIEQNDAAPGQPPTTTVVAQQSVLPGNLAKVILPTRELDCGTKPNDAASPGTCLSSRAYRITSSTPIVVYQFNVFTNSYSNDASLLLPTNALGQLYRVIGWPAGHPVPTNFPGIGLIVDRSYVTIVGVKDNTVVKFYPTWRIKGNPPIAATAAGGMIQATLGPFDVLNLETDDATMQDDPKTMTDLSASVIVSSAPVAVFSGVETTEAPADVVDIPTYPGWSSGDTCCLDHLEEQMTPMTSLGTHYVITRSPIRSTGAWHEPDVLRFVGAAEPAQVTTSLPPPYDSFTLLPGEVKTTWTQTDIVVSSDKPVMVGQILISNQYVDGPYIGDPSLTVFSAVEQYRTEYVYLAPPTWQNYVVISNEVGSTVTLDGTSTDSCVKAPAGSVDGKTYEARRCSVNEGVHSLSGDKPFGIVAYGYGSAGSYAMVGGANVKHIYDPPPIK